MNSVGYPDSRSWACACKRRVQNAWGYCIFCYISFFVCLLPIQELLLRAVVVKEARAASEGGCINVPPLREAHISFSSAFCLLIHAKVDGCLLLISFLSNALVYMITVPAIIHTCSLEDKDSALFNVHSVSDRIAVHTGLNGVVVLSLLGVALRSRGLSAPAPEHTKHGGCSGMGEVPEHL